MMRIDQLPMHPSAAQIAVLTVQHLRFVDAVSKITVDAATIPAAAPIVERLNSALRDVKTIKPAA